MTKTVLTYLSILATMVLLDAVWLGGIAQPLYRRGIGHLMAPQPNLLAALAFYLLYAAGIFAFVVGPRGVGDWPSAAAWGALFGFMAYMTYDLTNLATLRDWPLALALVDTAWGCCATALAAVAGRLATDRLA